MGANQVMSFVGDSAARAGVNVPLFDSDSEETRYHYSPPTPRATRAEGEPPDISNSPGTSPEGTLKNGVNLLDHISLSEELNESLLVVPRKKGPSSLLGTGSSLASASDHSEFSDLESDSGIETSRVAAASPEVDHPSLHFRLSPKQRKKKKSKSQVLGDEPTDLGQGESASEVRIDSFISCLDDKVR